MTSVKVAFGMLALLVGAAAPAMALDPPAIAAVSAGTDGSAEATLVFTNSGSVPEQAPMTVSATISDTPVTLHLLTAGQSGVPAGGFARLRYGFAVPAGTSGDMELSFDGGGAYRFAETPATGAVQTAAAVAPASAPSPTARADHGPIPPPVRSNNAFLGNVSSYNPVYALLGSGTDTNAKLQISFKYQLFGHQGDPDGSWLNGFHFAYTQRMFWDTAANSAPFRDVNYQPEFLYFYTLPKNQAGDQLSVRGGFLHESNGRDGDASRGYNIVYVQPQLDFPIGGLTASVGPRVFKYVIGRDNNPDIARYRGHQALAFSIGAQDGLELSTFSRLNFGTGKGSVDADLSYPLTRIWHELPLYVVVQGFTGYGEDLLDYDRKQTRLRVGIGIVR